MNLLSKILCECCGKFKP